MLKQRRLHAVK